MCCEQASTLTLSLIAEPKPPNTGRMTLNPNLPSQGTDVCDGWFHGEAAGVPGKEGGGANARSHSRRRGNVLFQWRVARLVGNSLPVPRGQDLDERSRVFARCLSANLLPWRESMESSFVLSLLQRAAKNGPYITTQEAAVPWLVTSPNADRFWKFSQNDSALNL